MYINMFIDDLEFEFFDFHPAVNAFLDPNPRLGIFNRSTPLMYMSSTTPQVIAEITAGCSLTASSVCVDSCTFLEVFQFALEFDLPPALLLILASLEFRVQCFRRTPFLGGKGVFFDLIP